MGRTCTFTRRPPADDDPVFLLAREVSTPARAVYDVVSVALGNLDLHAKTISLLHHLDGSMSIAPVYDVVPQIHLPSDGELALAIAGEYRHAKITIEHLVTEGLLWVLPEASAIAEETLATTLEIAKVERPHERAHPDLSADIERFTSNLLEGRTAGEGSR